MPTQNPLEQRYYSTREVAEMFGVTPGTVRDWIKKKKLDAIKLNQTTTRVPESELMRLANNLYGDNSDSTSS